MNKIPDNLNIKKVTPTFTNIVTTIKYEMMALLTSRIGSMNKQGLK